jgi:hypothetical protein
MQEAKTSIPKDQMSRSPDESPDDNAANPEPNATEPRADPISPAFPGSRHGYCC